MKSPPWYQWRPQPKVPRLTVVIFTRQLASMLGSGVPLVSALSVLSEQSDSPVFGKVLLDITRMVNSGMTFSVALHENSHIFSRVYVVMVRIGEQTGQLEDMLERLGDWLERDEQLRQRVLKALTYPSFVCGLAILMTLGLFYTVVPSFLNIFEEMHVELPLITRVVKAIADGIRNPASWFLTLSLALIGWQWTLQALRRPGAWCRPYRLLLRLPVVGNLLRYSTLARLTTTFGVLLQSGVDLAKAIHLSTLASANPLWQADLPNLEASIREGKCLSEYLESRPDLYPSTLTQMILAGEESARLDEMVARAAGYFEVEMGFQIDALSSLIEPLLLAGVSVVVGSVVVSLFLPLYGFLGKLGS